MKSFSIHLLLCTIILFVPGCKTIDDSFEGVRDYIHGLYRGNVSTTFELALNTDNLGILKNMDSSFELEKDYNVHIKEISRIEIGAYKPVHPDETPAVIESAKKHLAKVESKLKRIGYRIVKDTNGENKSTVVLIKESKRHTAGSMYIVHFSTESFILAKVHGTFEAHPSTLSRK